MKIGLLNLPFDNNYGGNLQRYALVTVLQRMGHRVEHINLQRKYGLSWFKKPYSYTKRITRRLFLNDNTPIFLEKQLAYEAEQKNASAIEFYEKYIPHTRAAYSISDVKAICAGQKYDAYIVGSDQVWREGMTGSIGLENYFLKFAAEENVKRLAYAVSMGNDKGYSQKQINTLTPLYRKFDAVSVREYSALRLLKMYDWNVPEPEWTMDPTMLLLPSDYEKLVDASNVSTGITSGKIFGYILDMNSSVGKTIKELEHTLGMGSVATGLADTAAVSIEQWLCNILNCEFVITDSFHGTVFSVLFNKPFLFVGNERRGNARIDSLFKMLDITDTRRNVNWFEINKKIEERRNLSFEYLQKYL